MAMQTRHFVFTSDGRVREFSAAQAAMVAAGNGKVPEFAHRRVRYLQITVLEEPNDEIRVQTAGGCIGFDEEGRLKEAGPPGGAEEQISSFELDACVEWALRDLPAVRPTFH